jgi:hypothetical protein
MSPLGLTRTGGLPIFRSNYDGVPSGDTGIARSLSERNVGLRQLVNVPFVLDDESKSERNQRLGSSGTTRA